MFVGAVMALYSQQACATLHWRMRKTAGSPACQGPDSFLSSYGPITLFITDAQVTAIPLPMEPLVCHIWTVKKNAIVNSRCCNMVQFLLKSNRSLGSVYPDFQQLSKTQGEECK